MRLETMLDFARRSWHDCRYNIEGGCVDYQF
jgi:hypothetical protein